jgi:hypothetical protein
MTRLRSTTIVWLLALVLPFQALTVAYLDLHAPAHFHVAHDDDHEHPHGHDDDHDHGDGRAERPGHSHAHGPFDRHHHDAGDPSVVVIHEDEPGEVASGWSGVMCTAIASAPAALDLARLVEARVRGHDPRVRSRSLPPLERPPRATSA